MVQIANFFKAVTDNMADEKRLAEIRAEVVAFSNRFTLP
jgi:glycine/serine hydroxymethyltransferase